MTLANTAIWKEHDSITSQLLTYASQQGIHVFRPEDSNRNLILINQDQGVITLVFSDAGDITHKKISKRIWNIPLVRWFYARWLTY